MKINNILKKCTTNYITKNLKNSDVKGISFHSREIKKNYIFAAVKGFENNGEKYVKDIFKIEDIILIVSFSFKIIKIYKEIPIIKTKNVRKLAGEMASIIYPNKIDDKIAVTGTNGKTSIAHYISEISSHQNISNCTLGTLGVIFNKKKIFNTSLTTNDSVNNHKILNKLSNKGCKRVIFEASSIGLHQNRLQNIKFNKIAISNLTVDHLDYHKNFLNYKQSKSILFKENFYKKTSAIINADLKDFKFFRDLSREKGLEILDYGKNANFFKFINFKKKRNIIEVNYLLNKKKGYVKSYCSAEYQFYNKICALLLVFGSKISNKIIKKYMKLSDPEGRLEKIYDKKNIKIFIDYAHTPDALKNVLSSFAKDINGDLVVVFGCGGNRDPSKRPLMTKEAIKYCNKIYFTSDNPRNEKQSDIFNDMKKGIHKSKLNKIKIISDRRKAIYSAIDNLKSGDVLVVAGKGHENYQIIKNKKISFSDKEVVLNKLTAK